jgi:CPA2 family monovalent cation:H+ antiporter-2
VFAALPGITRRLQGWPALWRLLHREPAPATAAARVATAMPPVHGHAIVVGHGRVGSAITRVLAAERLPFVVIERDRPRFDQLREAGLPATYGDAAAPGVLEQAYVDRAALLIVATPDSYRARRVLELARAAHPGLHGVIRTHSDLELERLRRDPDNHVVMGERELARSMLQHVLRRFGVPPERARLLVRDPGSSDLAADAERR